MYKDAEASIKWLISKGIFEENIILYGESLGTAVAIHSGQFKKFAGIILEAPFTSMVDMGKKYYPIFPVRFLLKDKFESKNKIKNLISPLLVMHGKKDNTQNPQEILENHNFLILFWLFLETIHKKLKENLFLFYDHKYKGLEDNL